jgi:hypothetical protein
LKIADEYSTVFCVRGDRAQAAIPLGGSIIIVIWIDELVDDASCPSLIGVSSVFICVFGDIPPLLEGIGALYDFFFKNFVALLILSKLLFLLLCRNKIFIVFLLVFLPIYGLKVAFFCVPLLQIELPFEFDIIDGGVHFDDVVPEYLFLVEGLLDFPDGQIRCGEYSIVRALKGFADKLFGLVICLFCVLKLLGFLLKEPE